MALFTTFHLDLLPSRGCGQDTASTSQPASPMPLRKLCVPQQHRNQSLHHQLRETAMHNRGKACRAATMQPMQSSSTLGPQSVDPMSSQPGAAHIPGKVHTVHSSEELDKYTAQDKVTVLMCKSSHCRPCKGFIRKYTQIAARFPDCVMLDIIGDESPNTRRLMMDSDVKVTPTFRLYRDGKVVSVLTGTNEKKLRAAIREQLHGGEEGYGQSSYNEEDEEVAKAAALSPPAAAAMEQAATAAATAPAVQQTAGFPGMSGPL